MSPTATSDWDALINLSPKLNRLSSTPKQNISGFDIFPIMPFHINNSCEKILQKSLFLAYFLALWRSKGQDPKGGEDVFSKFFQVSKIIVRGVYSGCWGPKDPLICILDVYFENVPQIGILALFPNWRKGQDLHFEGNFQSKYPKCKSRGLWGVFVTPNTCLGPQQPL